MKKEKVLYDDGDGNKLQLFANGLLSYCNEYGQTISLTPCSSAKNAEYVSQWANGNTLAKPIDYKVWLATDDLSTDAFVRFKDSLGNMLNELISLSTQLNIEDKDDLATAAKVKPFEAQMRSALTFLVGK